MRRWLARIATLVGTGLAMLIVGTRVVLDVIGYSTSPEDAVGVPGKALAMLNWIASQPWLLAYGVPALLIGFGALTLWPHPPPPARDEPPTSVHTVVPIEIIVGEDHRNDLVTDRGSVTQNRRVRILVRNAGNVRIADCSAHVSRIQPLPLSEGGNPPWLLVRDLVLEIGAPGTYIDVARRFDSDGSGFRLSVPPMDEWGGGGGSVKLENTPYDLDVAITCSMGTVTAQCRLFVDEQGQLALEAR